MAGTRYLATSGGLVQLDPGGEVRRRYTTLDGLPDNDLTALAVFQGRLFIGTATHGLVAFDGTAFTGYSFVKPKAGAVRALAATESRLLIGTLDGGLFEYDGERFSRRLNSATGADFKQVTAVMPVADRIYIGTQDLGLYIWQEARFEHIGVSDGLPSPHVTGIAALDGSLSSNPRRDRQGQAVATSRAFPLHASVRPKSIMDVGSERQVFRNQPHCRDLPCGRGS